MKFESLPSGFGVRVYDVDPRTLTPEDAKAIRMMTYRERLVVLPDQDLDAAAYVAFSYRLARPQVYLQPNYHHPDHAEIFVSANGPVHGRTMGVARTGYYWHSDCAFEANPLAFSMLYPQVLPKGERSTHFLDMAKAWRRLPSALRERVLGLHAMHCGRAKYKIQAGDVGRPLHELLDDIVEHSLTGIHPLVIQHPGTGEELLYASSGFTSRILGLSVYESWSVLREIFRHAEDPAQVVGYEWEDGDIALWDNRALLHRTGATPAGENSAMFRIGLFDEYPLSARTQMLPADMAVEEAMRSH
ncbi:TauD/TfdA dioxygenase family protein [Haliangium ochraceum]|uniref:Taurine catabolism dioxygenase TauD/TfdA n=1 Tax=Haliangium ochraceum (strain DSM 14365 / JCM 11303 / SMP-2) TaxID=502025 RepID=D0LJY5_HALO1|nr:TauD/TfdA family dioxygenase [Haliangium ochraceum]ACY18492.1 Taurine catabolism dioxygenase TauD/TfdA [Haliangium ochraceum DSM 14365]